jgi:hypothetical protein
MPRTQKEDGSWEAIKIEEVKMRRLEGGKMLR